MMVFQDLLDIRAQVYAEAPQKDIHSFVGTFRRVSKPGRGQYNIMFIHYCFSHHSFVHILNLVCMHVPWGSIL